MNTSGSKDILFWSPQCPYSRNLLNRIQNTPMMDKIILFNVHDTSYELPNFVQAVPTLFLKVQRKVLINESLTQWVNQQLHFYAQQQYNSGNIPGGAQPAPTSSPNDQAGLLSNPNNGNYNQSKKVPGQIINPDRDDDLAGKNDVQNGILEYNPGEMSTGFSDNFSFISNDKAVAPHNYAFVGEKHDTPPITGINMKEADMGDFPTKNNSTNSNNMNNKMNNNTNNNTNYNSNSSYGSGDLSYNPDPFANDNRSNNNFGNNNSNSNKDNQKQKDFDRKFEEMMKNREMSDSLAGLY